MRNFDEEFETCGYRAIPKILSEFEIAAVSKRLSGSSKVVAGDRRLLDHTWCQDLARKLLGQVRERELVQGEFVSVLCTYFSKNGGTNWGVAPHRDTCIPVRKKFHSGDWRNWTVKQDIPHVRPPDSLLRSMFAIRLNVDASGQDNGALEIVSGSHIVGRAESPAVICEGETGSALLMSPLLIHSSKKSKTDVPRRVLHFLYGPCEMSPPARWYYAV